MVRPYIPPALLRWQCFKHKVVVLHKHMFLIALLVVSRHTLFVRFLRPKGSLRAILPQNPLLLSVPIHLMSQFSLVCLIIDVSRLLDFKNLRKLGYELLRGHDEVALLYQYVVELLVDEEVEN